MKRSEMLAKIDDLLISQGHHKGGSFDLAWMILDLIEKNKMIPPERWRDMDWNEKGMTYAEWIQLPSKVNEWEKE